MPTAEINETEIYYELRGKGSPLLMIMGWTANLDWWPETLLKGLEKKHRLILFDNRGAGRTQNTDGCYSISQFAGDAAALLKFGGQQSPPDWSLHGGDDRPGTDDPAPGAGG